ncbi:SUKH-3 domain-containing protein [Actinoplanes sp. NEAU-A12]|uniref:SUKH-3 domain-containing protein n=1 Tax=Actinoplanes sandaracinus TaxID=3045177 RepID=A0ABT6WSH0_9ACTN|nr:SUKH-3 domain-containing protein [Actinoplanes sandaracinus]MDI6102621.1 SUKH-3 domain-containing protein [Actinoplanes sandaracinus]
MAEGITGRFSWETERVLRDAEWYPGRSVAPRRWTSLLAAEGFRVHAAAEEFLSEFGGLAVDVSGSGLTCAREPFSLYPTSCSGEEDRIAEWGVDLGKHFYPLGESSRREFFIVMDEDGGIFLMMDRVGALGVRERGLESLVRGIAPEWLPE